MSDITNALASELGIHPKDIELEYDPITGEVEYTISDNSVDALKTIQELLTDPTAQSAISDAIPANIAIDTVTDSDTITAEVNFDVDVSESSRDNLNNVNDNIVLELSGDYNVSTVISFVTSAPSAIPTSSPSLIPSTNIPTTLPFRTGLVVASTFTKVVTDDIAP